MNNKRLILVTGASSDLGLALMKNYLHDDAIHFLAVYNSSRTGIQEYIASGAKNVTALQCDLSSVDDIKNLIIKINEIGLVDSFVHMASPLVQQKRFKDMDWTSFQKHFDIQVKSAQILLSALIPGMLSRKAGKIVFVLSSYTQNVPPAALSDYVTSKYALLGLMKSLASEYRSNGINVNAVSPSMMETKFLKDIPKISIDLSAKNHPQKRNATPEDVIPTIEYLLSSQSNFVYGVNIPVTGGEVF